MLLQQALFFVVYNYGVNAGKFIIGNPGSSFEATKASVCSQYIAMH